MKYACNNRIGLFCKCLILCLLFINVFVQHCQAMNNQTVRTKEVLGQTLTMHPISKLLEKYKLIKKIGSGACGEIFLMQHKEKMEEYIVIKKFSMEKSNQQFIKQSFFTEAAFLQMLAGNQEIISLLGIYYEEKNDDITNYYLALEYAEQGSLLNLLRLQLRKYIKREYAKQENIKNDNNIDYSIAKEYFKKNKLDPAVPNESVFRTFAKQVLKILALLKEKLIIHRDIHIANIVLTENKLKLIDFGIAVKLSSENDSAQGKFNVDKLGTHTPPEVGNYCLYNIEDCPSYNTGIKTDLWSFGFLLYSLVTSKTTFDWSLDDTEKNIIIPFDEPVWKFVSNELKDLIAKLLKYNPDDRLSIQEIAAHPWFKNE